MWRASLVAQTVKNPPAMQETWVQSLHWKDFLEEGMTTYSSILAWRISVDKGAWPATVNEVTKSWIRLSDSAQHTCEIVPLPYIQSHQEIVSAINTLKKKTMHTFFLNSVLPIPLFHLSSFLPILVPLSLPLNSHSTNKQQSPQASTSPRYNFQNVSLSFVRQVDILEGNR